jgi:hypothetical protein
MAKLITIDTANSVIGENYRIRNQKFDWCAFIDGDDEAPDTFGWGTTEAEAVADWKRLQCEAEEASYDLDATLARINEAINEE